MSSAESRPKGRNLIRPMLSIAVIIVVFVVVLPRIADMSAVWETLTAMTWLEVATLTLAAGWNLVTYWVLLITALPGLTLTQAMIVTEASTAVTNSIPGGQAVAWGGIPDVCIVGLSAAGDRAGPLGLGSCRPVCQARDAGDRVVLLDLLRRRRYTPESCFSGRGRHSRRGGRRVRQSPS
jgi:hypothetical protein